MTIVQLFVNSLLLGGTYLLLAVGLNLIFGVMRIVNFAHGGMMVFAGLFVFWLSDQAHVNPVLAVVLAVAAIAAIGLVSEVVALEHIQATGVQAELLSLLVTYGVSMVLVNVSDLAFGAQFESLPVMQGSWFIGGLSFDRAKTVSAIIGIVCSVAVFVWLQMTRSGKQLSATSQSATGAQVCGINAAVVRRLAFAIGCALAGLAGALFIFQNSISPDSGIDFTVLAFVMIALGGPGKSLGSAVGAFGLALVTIYTGYYSGATVSGLAPYILLLLVMLVRFRGRSTFA